MDVFCQILQPHKVFECPGVSTKMGLPDLSLISTVPRCLKHFRTPYIVDSECPVSRAIVGPFSPAFYRTAIVTRLTRRVPLVEQELLTLPEHLSSPPVFSGVRVTRSLVLYVCFVDRCLSFCTFSSGHCVVCSFSIYGF